MNKETFLLEIGCEELPAKSLNNLSQTLAENIKAGLLKAGLDFNDIKNYHTPRRLSVMVTGLNEQQPNQTIERKGPAVNAPQNAIEGFLRANSISIEQLSKEDGRFVYCYNEDGKTIKQLMPEIVNKAILDLPIPKPMRWGSIGTGFIRPVHWIVLMYGDSVIPTTILGLETSNITYGHRFHYPKAIQLKQADDYLNNLETQGFIIVDQLKRKHIIENGLNKIADEKACWHQWREELLNEVTNLVEWPVVLIGKFHSDFLQVPKEALIATMEEHQKCFPLLKQVDNTLAPHFITVSNIVSKSPETVVHGNERVIHARLSDANFFYETDRQQKLSDRLEQLKHITFQAKLGTLYDKSRRIANLAKCIAEKLNINSSLAERAGLLCKTDLLTNMVGEFPELQGIMGFYYAKHDGEINEVATAIRDHHQLYPDKNNNRLNDPVSYAVALSDRLDTLVGIFGINQAPTSDKDPFGLRRAAIVILRILIDANLKLNLVELISVAEKNYGNLIINSDTSKQVHEFILDRLNGLCQNYTFQDENQHTSIVSDTLAAVLAIENEVPFDIIQRAKAIQTFRALPEASSLAEANKRANNLLTKTESSYLVTFPNIIEKINTDLFQHDSEHQLYRTLQASKTKIKNDYLAELLKLASLQSPLANFFNNVMVISEDESLKNNRLMLLAALRQACLTVADISLLQIPKQ